MNDYNRGALPDPCYRMSTGDGSRWRSVEFGDGTGYVRLDALERASEFAADMSGSCPLDMFDFRAKDCDAECDDGYAECWRRYFERGDDSE